MSSVKGQSRPMFAGLELAADAMDKPPEFVDALNKVLRPTPVNLRDLGCVARSFAMPAAQLLKLCNSSIFALDHPVHSLEQAAISLGADSLRTLSLAWGFVHQAGKLLAPSKAREFWQHNLTIALISHRIAAWRCYCASDAYLAGFLHDIGRVPFMIASEEGQGSLKDCVWRDESIEGEMLAFGVDHCEMGVRIAARWEFPESFLRVVGNHHQMEVKSSEPELVRIVSAAEVVCSEPRLALAKGSACTRLYHYQKLLSSRLPDLDPQDIRTLAEGLKIELLVADCGEPPDLRRPASSST